MTRVIGFFVRASSCFLLMSSFAAWAEKVDTSEVDKAKEEARSLGCKYAIGYVSRSQIGPKVMDIPFYIKICFWNGADNKCKIGYAAQGAEPDKWSTWGKEMNPMSVSDGLCTQNAIRKALNSPVSAYTPKEHKEPFWYYFSSGYNAIGFSKYSPKILHDELRVGDLRPAKKK